MEKKSKKTHCAGPPDTDLCESSKRTSPRRDSLATCLRDGKLNLNASEAAKFFQIRQEAFEVYVPLFSRTCNH